MHDSGQEFAVAISWINICSGLPVETITPLASGVQPSTLRQSSQILVSRAARKRHPERLGDAPRGSLEGQGGSYFPVNCSIRVLRPSTV